MPPKLSFREKTELYCHEMKVLAMLILGSLARALKVDAVMMWEMFEDGVPSIRMNYYLPCPEPSKAIGFSPHSDADALTILYQFNYTDGLQIRKDGIWMPIRPIPNALIVNKGDIMEIFNNGIYRNIEHRATVNSTKERLSVATFYSCRLDTDLGPAPNLVGLPFFRLFQSSSTSRTSSLRG
ncbi:hypothetical protein SAY86_004256 [Trapa natans]|uniref:Fe2OG dioxygenase domain-containing protein n=1 Tax=Trapa natans TaxID=22666 RepID=A0AAN7RFH6_TRANT|nr:hypothetical protein SAY86_004256 [Trapa natans]